MLNGHLFPKFVLALTDNLFLAFVTCKTPPVDTESVGQCRKNLKLPILYISSLSYFCDLILFI